MGMKSARTDKALTDKALDSGGIGADIVNRLKPMRKLALHGRDIGAYYRSLLRHDDTLIQAGAVCWLLDNRQQLAKARIAALKLRHFPCVRQKAFALFSQTEGPSAAEPFNEDNGLPSPEPAVPGGGPVAVAVEPNLQNFYATGIPTALYDAINSAESAAGWNAGLDWALRAMVLYGINPAATVRTFELLVAANQTAAVQMLINCFSEWQLFPSVTAVEAAAVLLRTGEPGAAYKILRNLPPERIEPQLRSRLYSLIAECQVGLGKFEEAATFYEFQNTLGQRAKPKLMALFPDQIRTLNALDIGTIGPDIHTHDLMMIGFPRSGTTLLESALTSHSDIATYEELPAFSEMAAQFLAEANQAAGLTSGRVEALRSQYYKKLHAQAGKTDARVHIDKMPVRSVYGPFLRRIFPDKRYIFSIRHPYDVVLSCFRTRFATNMGMVHFERFADTCALYDLAMSSWFNAFPETNTGGNGQADGTAAPPTNVSDRVWTVRYERLVEDFEAEIAGILTFLNVGWDDSVMQFATAAEKRRARTPSYAKVRQGLGLGVQTAWQDFRFLFETPEAVVLHKWVERFGYEGLSASRTA